MTLPTLLHAWSLGSTRVISSKFGTYTPGLSNLVLRVPGGVVRAGASAKAAQGAPLWATLSTNQVSRRAPYHARFRVRVCSKVRVTARGAGGGEGSKIRLLDDQAFSLPFKTKQLHTPKVGPIPPAHDPLEPIPHINVHRYPYTFTFHTHFHSIANTQHTRRRGG